MTTDNVQLLIRKTTWDIELTTGFADGEDIIDMRVDTGVAITGTCRMIKLRYNNAVVSTGTMTMLEMVPRAAENIGALQGIMLNPLSKGADITTFRGIQLKMEEDTGGATIATLHGININICLKSAPTYSAAIRMESTDSYAAQYGIDMNTLGPTMAAIKLPGGPCIITQAGAPTRVDLPEGTICLRTDPSGKDSVLYVFWNTTWTALSD